MKILVTGAAGFLGSEVVKQANDRGHTVRCFVRTTSDVSRLNVEPDSLSFGDMTDELSLNSAVQGMDAVIHCAAATSEGAPDLDRSRKINVVGTRKLAEAAEAADATRWIQISSMSAHRGSTSVYGTTKREADDVLKEAKLEWTILRPSLIFGPDDKGLVAKTQALMKKLPVMPVVGPGTEKIRPVHVADVARAALDCLERPRTVGKTYMIGGADEIELNEFFRMLGERIGARRPMIHIPIPVAMLIAKTLAAITSRPPITVDNVLGVKEAQTVDIEDARRDLDFKPRGFIEGLSSVGR